jgi:hypothetical protein
MTDARKYLAPMPRRMIEAAEAKGHAIHVSRQRTGKGLPPRITVSISGKPRRPFGEVMEELERLAR